ncbi:methionine--tRNA ligase [Candidatus Babeliales bacterium]|nr:methionine--tRNA ligase [Candidatus Babeliales bacterium]
MKNNHFYVTTPLYYVNSKPHLGTLYTTLLADVAARFKKLMGKEVFFLTGTDEHGQKVADKAKGEGKKPKEFVDSMIPAFKDTWKLYGIEYNKFIRTTDSEHEVAVTKLIKELQDRGDIYKSEYSGWYCVPCETFITITSEILKENSKYLCPSCKRELKEIKEENYFFRLSAYGEQLLKFYEDHPNFIIPRERLNEVVSFVKSGLEDLSISRKAVKWGIPFPGDPEHTIYVWADALTNYIAAIGYGQDDEASKENFKKWWPADIHMMAKDIVRFHAIYWPAFLMALDLPIPQRLLVHGYILTNGDKMSKSLGNVIDPSELAKEYGTEPIRYYFIRQMSVHQDGKFDIGELENRISADLANNLGNLLSRTVSLAINNDLETVFSSKALEPASASLHVRCEEAYRAYWDGMNHFEYHIALADLWKFISEINVYFNDQRPWKIVKENKELFEEIISSVCHCLETVALMAWPIMPKKMETLLNCLGQKFDLKNNYEELLRKNIWNRTYNLKKPEIPLFVRPEKKE